MIPGTPLKCHIHQRFVFHFSLDNRRSAFSNTGNSVRGLVSLHPGNAYSKYSVIMQQSWSLINLQSPVLSPISLCLRMRNMSSYLFFFLLLLLFILLYFYFIILGFFSVYLKYISFSLQPYCAIYMQWLPPPVFLYTSINLYIHASISS